MQQNYFLPAASLKRWLFVAGTLLAVAPTAQAQLAHGSTSAQNATGTFTDLGTTGTAITTANTDNANSAAQNIGFSFTYNGTAFTQFVLNTNGLLRLGSAAPSGTNMFAQYEDGMQTGIAPIESTNAADVNLLIPFNTDLEAGSGTGGAEYRVSTTGTAPNQVCTIQWKNVSDKSGNATTGVAKQYANMTFQVKLYQTSNTIEFVYGTFTASTNADAIRYPSVGIKGSSNGGGQDVLANKEASTSAWSTTAFITGEYSGTTHNFRKTVAPDAGRTYRFTTCSPLAITSFPYTENFDALAAKQYFYSDATYGTIPTDVTSPLSCGATSIDVNADANSWFVVANDAYNTASSAPNALVYAYNLDGTTAANDWYFTPGLSLRVGYKYQLQFKYRVGNGTYPEALEVKYGTSPTVAAQTTTLFSNGNITTTTYTTTTAANVTTITPAATGTYYIGFHVYSAANQLFLLVDDMQVTETAVLGVRNATNSVFTAEASPVPFGDRLNLTISTLKPGPAQLTVRDALGRTLRQSTTATLMGSSTLAVPDAGSLPSGVYFLTVEQGGQSQMLRVVHQ
ncbi:MAG: T9SS type A sorting domain-containing protein [Hymenobacter sp.]|nr:MAG: T9SS type A sorting domain-containing protein [Hymenobacter sp.]